MINNKPQKIKRNLMKKKKLKISVKTEDTDDKDYNTNNDKRDKI